MRLPRIALFSDCCDEGIEASAKRRNIQMLSVHAGSETRLVHDGSIARFDVNRLSLFSLGLDHELRCDLSMWRHIGRVEETLRWFDPDVIHLTGPSDIGVLGACLGQRLGVPIVASWQPGTKAWTERHALQLLMLFCRVPRVLLAPKSGLPGPSTAGRVDAEVFTPARRRGHNAIVNIGYVGELSAEKNVKLLHTAESELDAEGLDVRFTIVGDGNEREWLSEHMLRAEFTGVLSGEALADAYAQMDIVALPSETNTSDSVVFEAMAAGVPVVAMAAGRQHLIADAGRAAIFANGPDSFVQGIRTLVKNRPRREAMGIAARAYAVDLRSWDRFFVDMCLVSSSN